MDGIVFTQFPDISIEEIKTLIKKDATITPTGCIIKDVSVDDLAVLSFRLQSASRVGIYLCQTKNIKKFALSKDLLKIFKEGKTFAVTAVKHSNNPIPSTDLAAEWGAIMKDLVKLEVDLTSPDVKVFVSISKNAYELAIDLVGFDMSKRPYKLFNNPTALNGAVAFALCKYSKLTKTTKILDPFCGSGVINIEAALFQQGQSCFVFEERFSGLKLPTTSKIFEKTKELVRSKKHPLKIKNYGFDEQLRIILGARKNAKIAGVFDAITFSKASIDWIDSKFEENEVECIITQPPEDGKRQVKKRRSKDMLDELFYQAKYVLKKKGTVNILQRNKENALLMAEKHGFKLLEEKFLSQGKQPFIFLRFSL